jgi:predicted TIM-barrel fold metal-dependent hydrolase
MILNRRTFLAGAAAAAVTVGHHAKAAERKLFDSHFHIIDPRFPIVPNQGYTPPFFTLDAYLSQVRPLGVVAGAVVSASFQAYDQTYLAEALSKLGKGWVGVSQIPNDMPDAEIVRLGGLGVRALRFNIFRGQAWNMDDIVSLATRAHAAAGWHAEFYADAAELKPHVDRLAKLPRISIDHLGMTEAGLPVVLDLVAAGAWVKATGFGRVSMDVENALERIAAKNPNALVFGTDLPSTRAKVPFSPSDVDLIQKVLGTDVARKTFWDNPVALYRVEAA